MNNLAFTLTALAVALLFFAAILVCIEVGWRMARRDSKIDSDASIEGTKPLEASLFGLLGLLLAFTFSGALSRFDSRRHLVIDETNMIGTAYLRLDVLPAAPRAEIQQIFRNYLDMRIDAYRNIENTKVWNEKLAASQALQTQIWNSIIAATTESAYTSSRILILPALNQMIDITTTRSMWTQMHPPPIIFVLLVGIGLACSVVAGYSLFKDQVRRWLHIVGFAFVLAFTFYVIVDIEFPRYGLIRVDGFDHAMVDLRANMN